MANNKVILGDEVLIDLTQDTVTSDSLVRGFTAHNAMGEEIEGTVVPTSTVGELTDVELHDAQTNQVLGYSKESQTWTNIDRVPVASEEVLGGIKVGANLSMNNGKLNAPTNISAFENDAEYLADGDISSWAKAPEKPTYTAEEVDALPNTTTHLEGDISIAEKGANGGVATLGGDGKIPSSQLPSYVDDVLEFIDRSAFPTVGESGKIYIDLATNKTYRWGGTTYISIASDLALGETSSTAYAGDKGKATTDNLEAHRTNTEIHVTSSEKATWSGKQNALSQAQLNAVNSGISSSKVTKYDGYETDISKKYTKPTSGIPASDLAESVRTSLGKADTALQSYEETDPTVPSHVKAITTADIAKWNAGGGGGGGVSSWFLLEDKPFEFLGSDFDTEKTISGYTRLILSDAIKYGYITQLKQLPNDSPYKMAQYVGNDGDYFKHGYIYEHFDTDTHEVYFAFDDAETSKTYYVKTDGNTLKSDSRGKIQIYSYSKLGQTDYFRLLYNSEFDSIEVTDWNDYLKEVSASDPSGSKPNLNLSRKGYAYSEDIYDKESGHRIWQRINVQPNIDLDPIDTRIVQLETTTKTLETEVGEFQATLENQGESIGELKFWKMGAEEEISYLDGRVSALNSTVKSDLIPKVDDLELTIDTELEEFGETLKRIESEVGVAENRLTRV